MRQGDRTNSAFLRFGLCCIGLIGLWSVLPYEASLSMEMSLMGSRFQEKRNADLAQRMVHSPADETALFNAIKSNDVKTAKRLLEEGISVDVKDDQGFTPLMVHLQAQQYDPIPTPMLALLLRYRPDFHSVGPRGATLWDCLYGDSEPGTSGHDRSEVAVALLKASPDTQKDTGKLLVKAAFHGDTEMIKTLIDQGTDLSQDGGKALVAAAFWGENIRANPPVDTMRFLIDHGAYQPDDPDSRSAFRTIAFFGELGLTQQMLARGAARHKSDLSEALIGASGAAGGLDINWGNVKVVNLLLQNGADPNGPTTARGQPLFHALGLRDREIVQTLVKHGADVNVRDEAGDTPLMSATFDPAIVRLLLRHGANPNAKSKNGRTALSSMLDSPPDAATITKRLAIQNAVRRLLKRAGARR
ncbi:MAG: hypothetical protein JWL77_5416 [Chthonomonadaceae bacterium]|nr:hypothetical protein [Chthonomonadaceae bacterium]